MDDQLTLTRGKRRTGQARGLQRIEWIPIGSQVPSGIVATPPHLSRSAAEINPGMTPATFGTVGASAAPGPPGTVPVPHTGPGAPRADKHQSDGPPDIIPGGQYFHAQFSQQVTNYGGSANLNVWRPQVESQTNHDHSIVQTWLSNSQNPHLQTLEAGWEVCPTEYGDALPHLFVFYTTNGYTKNGDDLGGMNFDYKGWVQVDRTIIPTGVVTNTSVEDGEQVILQIRYELFEGNWWLRVNDVFIGYYPASLFMPGQSRFDSLGDHADRIVFGGEVLSMEPDPITSRTSMGSGFFAEGGLGRACFVSNMEFQSDRRGTMAPLNGGPFAENPGLYDVQAQMLSKTPMGSFLFAGGPGAQASKRAPALAQTPRKAMALAFVADDQTNEILACTTSGPLVDNTWSGNTPSGQSSKMAPSLAVLNDTLFMAFVADDDSNQLLICSSGDGLTWSANTPVGQFSKSAPALAAIGDRLVLAFVANHQASEVLICWSDNRGRTWPGQVDTGQFSRTAPALAAYGGDLVLAFVATDDARDVLVCRSADQGQTWSANTPVGQFSKSAPALAQLGGKLFVAFVANDDSNDLLVCSTTNAANWPAGNFPVRQSSKTEPSLAAFDDQLLMAFVADNDTSVMLVCLSPDGQTWSGNLVV